MNFEAAAYFSLAAARLSPEHRSVIENGTVAKLVGVDLGQSNSAVESVYLKYKNHPKIDTHWHTGQWQLIEPRTSFSQISEELNEFNIQFTCSSSIKSLNWDIVQGNRETRSLMDQDQRVCGLIVVDPWNPELSLQQIELYSSDPRFVGIKTIQDFYLDRSPLSLDHPSYEPILQWANAHAWPVMAHLPGMFEAAKSHPKAHFVAAHSTWRFGDLSTLDNVFFDVATSSSLRADADFVGLVEKVGENRVIFSSDSQLMGPAWTLGKLESSGLSWAVIEKILNHNALNAFPRMRELRNKVDA